MHISTLLLPLIATLSMAYKLSQGLENGVYTVHLDSRCRKIHKRVGDAVLNATESSLLPRQDTNDCWCGCAFNLNHGDTNAAVAALKGQTNGVIDITTAYYSISGGTVAFACPITPHFGLSADGITKALGFITALCGNYIAGTYKYAAIDGGSGSTTANIGYMTYVNGLDFCGHAEGSGHHSC